MELDYWYLHETPVLQYTVRLSGTNPEEQADVSKAEFHRSSHDGPIIRSEQNLKRKGSGKIDVPIQKWKIELKDSPIFVVFTFTKGNLGGERPPLVLALAEPAVHAISAPKEATPGEEFEVAVTAWDAKAYDQPGSDDQPGPPGLYEERKPERITKEVRDKVRWRVGEKEIAPRGEKVKTKVAKEDLGKFVKVQAYLGDKPPDEESAKNAPPPTARFTRTGLKRSAVTAATAMVAVPKVTIVNDPDGKEPPKSINRWGRAHLLGKIEPEKAEIEGTYAWTATEGADKVKIHRADKPVAHVDGLAAGNATVKCTFTSKATGKKLEATHKLEITTMFALLDHFRGSAGAAKRLDGLWDALHIESSPELEQLIDEGVKQATDADKKNIGEARFAVIDLNGSEPRYAGRRDTEMVDPASTGKTILMFGAYQLRFDLAVLAAENKQITDLDALYDRARYLWGKVEDPRTVDETKRDKDPTIVFKHRRPGQFLNHFHRSDVLTLDGERIKMVVANSAPSKFKPDAKLDFGQVQFDRIFDKNAGIPPKFKETDPRPRSYEELKEYEEPSPKPTDVVSKDLGFMDRVKLMIAWSSNEAAETVAHEIGMVYVNSPMWRAGLFDPKEGGIWIGDDYHQHAPKTTQFPSGARLWKGPPFPKGAPGRVASAKALATLFAAIFTDKDHVLDKDSRAEMRAILRNPAFNPDRAGFDSFIRDAVQSQIDGGALTGKIADLYSKIGVDWIARRGDTAFVVRDTEPDANKTGKTFKYVFSILPVDLSASLPVIKSVVKVVDQAVTKLNHLP